MAYKTSNKNINALLSIFFFVATAYWEPFTNSNLEIISEPEIPLLKKKELHWEALLRR